MNEIVVSLGAMTALAFAGASFGQCGQPASCLDVHDTPGCVVVECCEAVCEANPLCCEFSWDMDCVAWAEKLCDGLTCPSPGSCTEVHFTPGCEDADCCHFACEFDYLCCYSAWDQICVEIAETLCGVPACTIMIPPTAVDEGEPCYDHLNDGCNVAGAVPITISCGDVRTGKYATGAPRDTDWYSFSVAGTTKYAIQLTAEFPGQLMLVKGPCLGPTEVLADLTAGPCGTSSFQSCLEPGDYSIVVAAALDDLVLRSSFPCDEIDPDNPPDPKDPPPEPSFYGLRYVLSFTCGGCVLGDLDGDGAVGPVDLGILLGAWGGAGPADLDGDGQVGPSDLGILLGAWTP